MDDGMLGRIRRFLREALRERPVSTSLIAIIIGVAVFAVTSRMGTSTTDSLDSQGTSTRRTAHDRDGATIRQNTAASAADQDPAPKSVLAQAQDAAMAEAMSSGLRGQVAALEPEFLKSFVPETLGGRQRTNIMAQRNDALGVPISEATASFADSSGRTFDLEITDLGGSKVLIGLANVMGAEGNEATNEGYQKIFRENGRLITEQWERDSTTGEYSIVLADRFAVKLGGQVDDIEQLKAALAELDLARLESLKDEGVKQD